MNLASIKRKRLAPVLLAASLFIIPLMAVISSQVHATTLPNTYIRLNRMKSGTATSFRLVFKAVSNQTANVAINFNGGDSGAAQWTNATPGGLVNASQTVTTAQCVTDTGFSALPGSITAAGSGGTITISSVGATTSGSTYCADLTGSAVTTPTAGHEGEYHPTVTIGSDSTTVSVDVISADSIVITAVVPPIFNMSFDSTATDPFTANLSPSGLTSNTARTITLNTNAYTGWILWAKSTNGATKGSLQSAFAGNYKITPSNAIGSAAHTTSNNVDDYGLGVTATSHTTGTGTITVPSAYDGTSNKIGVLDSQNFQPISSSNGTANGDTVTFINRATISNITPAANDYTDTITFIGAGNF